VPLWSLGCHGRIVFRLDGVVGPIPVHTFSVRRVGKLHRSLSNVAKPLADVLAMAGYGSGGGILRVLRRRIVASLMCDIEDVR
jgi:hypothetical protein